MRYWLVVTLAIMAALLGSASAQAQLYGFYGRAGPPNYGPGFRPQLSPYLSIIQGRNFGVDYYLGTRQQFRFRQNFATLGSEVEELRAREGVAAIEAEIRRPVESGTPVTFGNTLGYYNNPVNYVQQPVGAGALGGRGGLSPSQAQAQAFSQTRRR